MLDTSAVLALMENEDGADRVETLLREHEVFVPWPVLMEIYYITLQEADEVAADSRYAMLAKAATVLWEMNEPTMLAAARLKAAHQISFADALIAACAARLGAILVHKDPEYDALAEEVRLEALPYRHAADR